MSRRWLALVGERPADASGAVEARTEDGEPAGWLAAWSQAAKPLRAARRADPRIFDAAGEAAWVSLVLPPEGVKLLFDDLAVQQARRVVLAQPVFAAVTTLLTDASHFAGSLVAARGPGARGRLARDPFARIFPARRLQIGPGLLGTALPPAGPTIERYGSDNPWPWDRFG